MLKQNNKLINKLKVPKFPTHQTRRKWRPLILGLSGFLLVGSGVAGGFGWFWVKNKLSPLIQSELSTLLARPVQIGQVTGVSPLGQVKFSQSAIPSTSLHPDYAQIEKIKVGINLWQYLWTGDLNLQVNLINPSIYLQQREDREWLSLPPVKKGDDQSEWIKLEYLRFTNANLTLTARDGQGGLQTPVNTLIRTSTLHFLPEVNVIELAVTGELNQGGNFRVTGSVQTTTDAANLVVRGQEISAQSVSDLLPLPLDLQAGEISGNLEVKLRDEDIPQIHGIASLTQAQITLPDLPNSFFQTTGKLQFQGYEIDIDVNSYFGLIPLAAQGVIDAKQGYDLQGQTKATSIDKIIPSLDLEPPPIQITGDLSSTLRVTGDLENPQVAIAVTNQDKITLGDLELQSITSDLYLTDSELAINNLVALPVQGGMTRGEGKLNFARKEEGDFRLNLRGENIPIASVNLTQGELEIWGPLTNLEQAQAQGKAQLSLGNATIALNQITYQEETWQTQLVTRDLQLPDLGIAGDNLPQGGIDADLNLSGGIEDLSWETIQATGIASLDIAQGTIATENLHLKEGKWQTSLNIENLILSELIDRVSPQSLNGKVTLKGSLNQQLSISQGTGELNLASGGKIILDDLDLTGNQLFLTLQVASVALNPIDKRLSGNLTGNAQINGTLNQSNWQAWQASGNLNLSQGIGVIDTSVTTSFVWDGEYLNLNQIQGDKLQANGKVAIAPQGEIKNIWLNVEESVLNLANFSPALDIQGKVNFQGQIQGNLPNLTLQGTIITQNMQMPGLSWESVLTGEILTTADSSVYLQLQGKQDQILLALDANYQPTQLLLQQGKSKLTGDRLDSDFFLTAENFPIAVVKAFSFLGNNKSKSISGQLSGNASFNFDNNHAFAHIDIASPILGEIKGESLNAQLIYNPNQLTVKKLTLHQGETAYNLQGTVDSLEDIPQLQAKLEINQGKIQDILETLQFFQLSDLGLGIRDHQYGDAETLYGEEIEKKRQGLPLFSIGRPNTEIIEQLRYLAQIYYLSQQANQAEETLNLPNLSELTGTVEGNIFLNGPINSGIKAEFSLTGKQWRWGNYELNQLLAKGNLDQGTLTLEPIRLQTGNSWLSFAGYFGEKTQTGEIRLRNIPIDLVEDIIDLPNNLSIGGDLDGNIKLGGIRDNPQAQGHLEIDSLTINQTNLYATEGSFIYKNANLDFQATSLITDNSNPIRISGNFPYQLPLATIKPSQEEFQLTVDIQDQGLSLVNILTQNAFTWEGGQGKVSLKLSGKFDQETNQFINLKTAGEAQFEEATLSSQFFTDTPFTQINGQILFDFDQIKVEELSGSFSGGNFLIQGNLPVAKANQNQSLKINLDYLTMRIKGLYQGGVKGLVEISGSLLEPVLTGELNLSQGQIILGETSPVDMDQEDYSNAIQFQGLKVNLQEEIKLIRPPILSFVANGSFNLFGSFTNPRPEGTIELVSGRVNLFTSHLSLAQDFNNRARFFPYQGLDPYLEIELVGSANETNSQDLLRDPLSSEVSDIPVNSFGTLETIRIQATVRGFASQLTNSLELSSSPPRSQQEIIALLGGSFVSTLGRGESTLGLANLAGSAIFGSFQGELADTLGLSELRIFPTPIIREDRRTETFGLATEIGLDLNQDLSFSVLKILTNTQPPQFGLRYRINDQVILRGSTDFTEDTRGIVEYQLRF